MENNESSTTTTRNERIIYWTIVIIVVIVGYYFFNKSNKLSNVVKGNIFEYQVKIADKYQTLGYIAFGTDKEDDGSLLYEKKSAIEEANKSGELDSQIYNASENFDFYWNASPEETILEWPSGLALPTALDEPFFSKLSISVDKVSGIFRKTITGKSASKIFLGGSGGTDEVRLIQIGKVKE